MMGTANTMCIIAEALGMSLSGNSSICAHDTKLIEYAYRAGTRVVEMWESDIVPRSIITEKALMNAIMVNMAIGGSTNTIVHIPAISMCAGLDLNCIKYIDKIGRRIPLLIDIIPNGPNHMSSFDRSGGVKGIYHSMIDEIYLDANTVDGCSVGVLMDGFIKPENSIVRTMDNPVNPEGALAILYGNIAPDGAVVKQTAVKAEQMVFCGPAKVFDSNDNAVEGLRSGAIEEGDIVIIRFCGAKGAPGMETTFTFTSELSGSRLDGKIALITDGRFSGATEGACIGYVSPEAALRGPLLAVRNGDIIDYNIPDRTINLQVDNEEIQKRITETPVEIRKYDGYLGVYQQTVGSVLKGAVMADNR